jgi:hypothetical protein
LLESHREVPAERAELVATLDCLAPRELRTVLNELNRLLGPDAPDRRICHVPSDQMERYHTKNGAIWWLRDW